MEDLIYLRQERLNLNIPKSVAVIGVGGVGSWVAFNLALTGVNKIILIDHDIVDEHNLNRTPFRNIDKGKYKVRSMMELIIERRHECTVIPIPKKFEELCPSIIEDVDIIVDCRDTSRPLPSELAKKVKIIGGYDGYKITIHINPDYENIWGEEPVRYRIVPSWLVPPQFIANLIILYLCADFKEDKELIITKDIRDIIKKILCDKNTA